MKRAINILKNALATADHGEAKFRARALHAIADNEADIAAEIRRAIIALEDALKATGPTDEDSPAYLIPMPPVAISATGTSGDDIRTADAITDSDRLDWLASKSVDAYERDDQTDGEATIFMRWDGKPAREAIDAAIKQEKP